MSSLCEEYVLCHTVDEALRILTAAAGSARLLAGGTDLLLELQQGRHPPVHTLVDVTEIEEMCALEAREVALFIGASVTIDRLVRSVLIEQHAQALREAAELMGNPQVSNVATIGGNVAHALPAADGTIALLALDAQAEIASPSGRRRVALNTLFKGPGESTLDPNREVLVGFDIPLQKEGQASAFVRRVNPQGIALALLNVAIWLERYRERVEDIRISVGPCGPVPRRMIAAENLLRGQAYSPERQSKAVEALLNETHLRTSLHRATEAYRRHLAGVLLDEAFSSAWHRAKEAGLP